MIKFEFNNETERKKALLMGKFIMDNAKTDPDDPSFVDIKINQNMVDFLKLVRTMNAQEFEDIYGSKF